MFLLQIADIITRSNIQNQHHSESGCLICKPFNCSHHPYDAVHSVLLCPPKGRKLPTRTFATPPCLCSSAWWWLLWLLDNMENISKYDVTKSPKNLRTMVNHNLKKPFPVHLFTGINYYKSSIVNPVVVLLGKRNRAKRSCRMQYIVPGPIWAGILGWTTQWQSPIVYYTIYIYTTFVGRKIFPKTRPRKGSFLSPKRDLV